tara:strand:- start:67 stop:924 length:858 start_codon:yes stop_codon:yes gene_type:complete
MKQRRSKTDRPRTRRPAPEPVEWKPVTTLGKKVKEGVITDIDQIFNSGESILEAGIVNALLPNLEEDLLLIGQAKGKFGGGQRRIFRQTQKKTREGNKIKFMACAVVGNKNGYVGVGTGKSKETVPARDKAKRRARLNLIRIRRGCGTWESDAREPNSIPFAVEGKCGSVKIKLMPAPKGKGLCIEKECAKILAMAGIKDIWSTTKGQTKTKLNLITALVDALKKLSEVKIKPGDVQTLGVIQGRMTEVEKPMVEEVIEIENPEEPVVDNVEATKNEAQEAKAKN